MQPGAALIKAKSVKEAQLLERRFELAHRYISSGKSVSELAKEFKVSYKTAYNDINYCKEYWKQYCAQSINALKEQEIEEIKAVRLEAWRAWQRSIGLHTKTTVKSLPLVDTDTPPEDITGEITKVSEELNGDPRFLDQVQKCSEQIRKILGLDEPARTTISNPDGGPVAFVIQGMEGAAWLPQAATSKSDPRQ